MKKQLTPLEAWDDFFTWLRSEPSMWAELKHRDRDRILKAQKRRATGIPYNITAVAIENIITQYAPGRYRFEKTVVVYITDQI